MFLLTTARSEFRTVFRFAVLLTTMQLVAAKRNTFHKKNKTRKKFMRASKRAPVTPAQVAERQRVREHRNQRIAEVSAAQQAELTSLASELHVYVPSSESRRRADLFQVQGLAQDPVQPQAPYHAQHARAERVQCVSEREGSRMHQVYVPRIAQTFC